MNNVKWNVDSAHSEIKFRVKHMMISNVTGEFKSYQLTVETEGDDFSKTKKIEFTADIDSLTTGNEQRDAHLKTADFFHAENHPQVKFTSSNFEISGDEGKLKGELSIAGNTHPITLDVEFGGIVKDPWGNQRAGFSVRGKVSRKEYGMQYHAALEAGGVVVGDEVRILVDVELVKAAE